MADPYSVLGVSRSASDAEVRAAYRRAVKLHHPDHNNGSPEAARRFEAVQEAYAEIQRLRAGGAGSRTPRPGAGRPRTAASGTGATGAARRRSSPTPPPPGSADPDLEARLADLEQQVLQARRAKERAEAAAREAARAAREAAAGVRAAAGPQERPSDEELGYITTDDTIGKILADARSQLSDTYGKVRQHPVAKRVADLIEGLEELTEKLDRPPKGKPKR